MLGYFYMYAGPTGLDNTAVSSYLDDWTLTAIIAGLASYRPPPAAYSLAVEPVPQPVLHVFSHGQRVKNPYSDDEPGGGFEIYYKSPSFLLSAGGLFLNSGNGHDELANYHDVAVAGSITLLPTRGFDEMDQPDPAKPPQLDPDLKFEELIRFEP